MSSSYFEIIELPSGELILKRREEGKEDEEKQSSSQDAASEGTVSQETSSEDPLITVVFSDEAKAFLGDYAGEVGRAMIGTGIQLAGKLYEQDVHHDDNQVLH
ncbi:MAG: hypothetical protein COB04_12790 [Gammaproteobacteria bacterium]|nr:MAG: hypothetical protein COB04_12790 [Gammaproteobacteria bacterium]